MRSRSKLQHYMNPLHVYCRLRDFGLSKSSAAKLGKLYEGAIRWLGVLGLTR
jgi:hypothetical protein